MRSTSWSTVWMVSAEAWMRREASKWYCLRYKKRRRIMQDGEAFGGWMSWGAMRMSNASRAELILDELFGGQDEEVWEGGQLDRMGQLEDGRVGIEFKEEWVGGAHMFSSLDFDNWEATWDDLVRGLFRERGGGCLFTIFSFGRLGVLSESSLNVGAWLTCPSSGIPQSKSEFGPNTTSILFLYASSRILEWFWSCMQKDQSCERSLK